MQQLWSPEQIDPRFVQQDFVDENNEDIEEEEDFE
jgi:hypothetical protein